MNKLPLRINDLLITFKKDFQRVSVFSFVFFLVKGSAFAAALWLSNMVSIADLGLFEYALSGGLILAVILNLGLQGAYPFFIIREKKESYRAIFFFHGLLVSGLILGLIFLNKITGYWIPIKFSLMGIMASVIGMQVLYSTILKSHEVLIPAILLDGGIFILINIYNILIYLGVLSFSFETLETGLMIYMMVLWGIYFREYNVIKNQFTVKKYKEAIHFGKHLVASSFLIILLTGGARIFIYYFLEIKEVGYYGFYFRLAAIIVMIHQIINIVFFKKMYQSDTNTLDHYFSLFVGAILIMSISLSFLVPVVFSSVLTLLENSYGDYKLLYFTLSFQVVFWIILALNENIIYREELSSKMNKGFFIILFLMLGTMAIFSRLEILNIFWLTIINMLAIAAAVEWQFFLLKKERNIRFTNTHLINYLALILFFITYNFIL